MGDEIVATVKSANPTGSVRRGDIVRAVIVRTARCAPCGRQLYRFDDNAAVIVDDHRLPSTHFWAGGEQRAGYMRIVSLAPEVL